METGLLVAYLALCSMAVGPIYYGSFASIKWPKKKKSKKEPQPPESDSSDEEETIESLSTEDAYLFPVFGSIVLFSLYLIFKLLDKDYVNYLVNAYFSFLGIIALTSLGAHMVRNFSGIKADAYKFTLTKKSKEIYRASFTVIHIGALILSFFLTAYYIVTKNWIASNLFGLAFAFNGIKMLSLDSFKTGMILLGGLFFYDIFWVFGTEVMVTVAKSFDAPIKVVWPKKIIGLESDEALQFTMLGLGDIVVPGIYVALCLRFDHNLYLKKNPTATKHSSFPTTYFNSCFAAYIIGLITTIVVMHTFKAAQPALLYLSPACIISVLITGVIRGELKDIFKYSSDDENTEEEETKDKSVADAVTEEEYVEVESSATATGGAKNRKNKKNTKKKTGSDRA
ncbi:8560_t:CDS:2 [Ambispora leptoticha]|uniref:8560_t:CDS:1 n=1 Tax=Ambispora leptoticha TaxID=144679 RepID=A0A9N9C5N5_9GLOM|nr:8560_t:CDS:2 [Ambispora leptoticha]